MSEISFRQAELEGSDYVRSRVLDLVATQLGGHRSPEEIARTIDYGHGTVVLGGFVGEEMVCMNAFMPMRFSDGEAEYIGYQSGFSATDANHRGKGYWPKLLKASEDILTDMSASFIFGYPNEVSHPLFVKKLGYTTLETAKTRLALLPGLFGRSVSAASVTRTPGTLRPDVRAHIAWKRRAADDPVVVFDDGPNTAWGKVRRIRKAGLTLRYLEIGSVEVADGADLQTLLKGACHRAGVKLCYISVNHDNELAPLLTSQGTGQPIIVKALGDFDLHAKRINFFGGLMDTY